MPNPRVLPILIAPLMFVVGSCASTVVETSESSTTVTVVDVGTVAVPLIDALPRMVALADGLGDLIVEGGSADDAALEQIQALWDGTDDAMNDIDPPLFREVEHQLELIDIAVQKKRPADADKATRNLQVVIDTYTERHPG